MVTAVLPLVDSRSDHSPIAMNNEATRLSHRAAREPDDGALLAAVAAGDVAALDLLYRRYRPLAFAVAGGLLHDRAAAEDCDA